MFQVPRLKHHQMTKFSQVSLCIEKGILTLQILDVAKILSKQAGGNTFLYLKSYETGRLANIVK